MSDQSLVNFAAYGSAPATGAFATYSTGASPNSVDEPTEVDEIVIYPGGGGYDGRYDYLYGGGGGGSGGGGGGSGGPTLGQQAAAFASQHLSTNLDLNDANNRAWYEQAHKALAALFIKATLNPNAFIDGPGAKNMTGAQVLASLESLFINLTSSVVGGNGALTHPNASYTSAYIEIGVPQMGGHETQFGADKTVGRNWVIFHEIGHATSVGLSYAQSGAADVEAFTNTLGASLAGFAGEPYPALTSLSGQLGGWLPF